MNFNKHSNLESQHAFLSPSKYHWINYDEEKLARSFYSFMAIKRGTELHDLACKLIRLGVKLPEIDKTLNLYVNDAIGFKMTPEQPLWYSENCFGTADAISFKKKALRIHDLKTGIGKTSMKQLEIYAAIFCLEYKVSPSSLRVIELRIYQSNSVLIEQPEPEVIQEIMDKIVMFDKQIQKIKSEE